MKFTPPYDGLFSVADVVCLYPEVPKHSVRRYASLVAPVQSKEGGVIWLTARGARVVVTLILVNRYLSDNGDLGLGHVLKQRLAVELAYDQSVTLSSRLPRNKHPEQLRLLCALQVQLIENRFPDDYGRMNS